jgi:hypothetical protein
VHKTILYFTCIALILVGTASAKDYGGIYVLQHETGAMTLTLQKEEGAGYRGNLTANGNAFDLRGIVQNGLHTGTFGDDLDALLFQDDNFWSTRFSAGNYDSGNQRGYVSVPGHGPVGYGF